VIVSVSVAQKSERIVMRCVEAFNARDLEGLGEQGEVESVCAVERISEGLIVAAHHYLTDTDMIERLGLIP
jgi:hypothetical protein